MISASTAEFLEKIDKVSAWLCQVETKGRNDFKDGGSVRGRFVPHACVQLLKRGAKP